MRLIVTKGAGLTVIGRAVGTIVALTATTALRNLPITVRPPNAAIIAFVAILICLATVLACLTPARRAANADPMRVLRNE